MDLAVRRLRFPTFPDNLARGVRLIDVDGWERLVSRYLSGQRAHGPWVDLSGAWVCLAWGSTPPCVAVVRGMWCASATGCADAS